MTYLHRAAIALGVALMAVCYLNYDWQTAIKGGIAVIAATAFIDFILVVMEVNDL